MLDAPSYAYRSDRLDLLRATLAIYVMLVHTIPWADVAQQAVPGFLILLTQIGRVLFQNSAETNPAVLAFIVLSGYCIHRNGFRDTADIGRYAVRRFFRIYPAYLAAAIAGMMLWSYSVEVSPTLGARLSGTADLDTACTVIRLTGIGALFPSRCPLGNAPLNTVMAEIWLYAAYPLLLLSVGRASGERAMWRVIIAIWIIGVLWISVIGLPAEMRRWWNTASVFGFLLYWWIGAKALDPAFRATLKANIPRLALLWVALSIPLVIGGDQTFILAETRKVISALLMSALIVRFDSPANAPAPLAALGRAGYSLYAFHAPIIYTLLILAWPWWTAVIAAISAGLIAYFAIEVPGIFLGRLALSRGVATATR